MNYYWQARPIECPIPEESVQDRELSHQKSLFKPCILELSFSSLSKGGYRIWTLVVCACNLGPVKAEAGELCC